MSSADQRPPTAQALIEQVVAAESGARLPTGAFTRNLIAGLAIAWSVFQLWIASPLPFWAAQARATRKAHDASKASSKASSASSWSKTTIANAARAASSFFLFTSSFSSS